MTNADEVLECIGGPLDGDRLAFPGNADRVFHLGCGAGGHHAAIVTELLPLHFGRVRGEYRKQRGYARWFTAEPCDA